MSEYNALERTENNPDSPEALLLDIKGRFDDVIDYTEREKGRGLGGHSVWLKRELDPKTQETTKRIVRRERPQGAGAVDYVIEGSEIICIEYSDDTGEPSVVDTSDPDVQQRMIHTVSRLVNKVIEEVEEHKRQKAQVPTDGYEKLLKVYAPGLGVKALKMIGIKKPYEKKQAVYEQVRRNVEAGRTQ